MRRLKVGSFDNPIQQKGWTGLGDAESIRAALDVLLAHDLIYGQTFPAHMTGGRPAERFIVHPGALTL